MSVGLNRAEASRLIAVLRHINDGQGDVAYMAGEGWHRASFADVADQLESAWIEVDKQRERAVRIDEGERRVLADYDEVVAERDSLRHQLAAVRVAIDGNRPLLATSEEAQRLVDDIIQESKPTSTSKLRLRRRDAADVVEDVDLDESDPSGIANPIVSDGDPAEAARPMPEIARGLRLILDHLDDGGHEWLGITDIGDVQAAREWIKSGGPTALADHLEAAEMELADIRSQRDAELAEVGSGRFDAEVLAESRRIEASSLRTERDSLRQQLEAAQRSDGILSASLESTMTELTAAQQRIAELEIELAEEYNEHERLRSIQLHTAARLVRTSQARRDHAESTIRTIWPVYRAAVDCETSDRENENGEYISHERAGLNLSRALDVARAALTPDVLAALKAMGLEIE